MDYVRSLRAMLWEHKKKVAVVAVAAGGYFAYTKIRPMVQEVRDMFKMMEKMEEEMKGGPAARQQAAAQRFAHHMRVSNQTLRELSVRNSRPRLEEHFGVAAIRAGLKGADGSHNLALWDQFKEAGLARSVAAVYATCLLDAVMKIQLSVISRHVLVDGEEGSSEANRCFMGVFQHAQGAGLVELAGVVREVVRDASSQLSLGTQVTFSDVATLLGDVRVGVERRLGLLDRAAGGPPPAFLDLVFPPPGALEVPAEPERPPQPPAAASDDPLAAMAAAAASAGPSQQLSSRAKLAEMVEECRLLLLTESFARALGSSLNAAFGAVLERLQAVFQRAAAAAAASGAGGEGAPAVVAFAKVMMRTTTLFDQMLPPGQGAADGDSSSFLFRVLEEAEPVADLCRVVYRDEAAEHPAASAAMVEPPPALSGVPEFRAL